MNSYRLVRPLLAATALCALIGTGSTARAFDCAKASPGVDFVTRDAECFEWMHGYAQGTIEAGIRNTSGSTFSVSCPFGQPETVPMMSFTANNQHDGHRLPGKQTFTLVVNGGTPVLTLNTEGDPQAFAWKPANDREFAVMETVVERIRTANLFAVERLNAGQREEFSTRGAAEALKGVLNGCGAAEPQAIAAEAASPAASPNSPDVAATLPSCTSPELRGMAERAVFKDLASLRLPVTVSTRQTILAEISRLSPDDSLTSRNAREDMGRLMAIPVQHILICAQAANPTGVRAIIIQNPDRVGQWGVMVLNYGVPNRAALEKLDFIEHR